jgi:hypothetical protein
VKVLGEARSAEPESRGKCGRPRVPKIAERSGAIRTRGAKA